MRIVPAVTRAHRVCLKISNPIARDKEETDVQKHNLRKVLKNPYVIQRDGRAIAQAVSRWLSTAAARVRARVWSCGICGGQSGAGAGFLRVLRFPLSIIIPPSAPQSPSSIIWGWYNRPVVAAVPSGLSLTPLRRIIYREITVAVIQILRSSCPVIPKRI
jgi:hypothetical protein